MPQDICILYVWFKDSAPVSCDRHNSVAYVLSNPHSGLLAKVSKAQLSFLFIGQTHRFLMCEPSLMELFCVAKDSIQASNML